MNVHPSRVISHCPLCQAAYAEKEIRFIGEQGENRLFHCKCEACGRAMMAMIFEAPGWITSYGIITDLEAPDAMRFHATPAVSSNDCVRFYQFLEQGSRAVCQEILKKS